MDLSPDERLESSVPQDVVDAGPEVEEFANALDDCLSPRLTKAEKKSRLLDLPRKYYANAIRRLDSKKHALDVDMDTDDGLPDDYLDEIEQLEKEAQTWDLLRRVLPLRYPDQLEASPYARLKIGGSRRNLLHDFLQKDPLAQERCAVLQWLQGNASSGPDIDELTRDLQQNADRGDIIAHGWLHTRSAIKLRKSVGGWPKAQERPSPSLTRSLTTANGEPLVTQLDPDATLRQDRKLEPKDEFFERAIWLGCFEHLRRGSSLETIRDWCQERTEMWRAVSMSAMLLSFDDQESPVEMDPKSLALWRRMCFNLARQGGSDDHERAVYGLLSGDIQTVEKIATTWDDFLFANYNALLRTQLDSYVLGQCSAHEASALTQSLPSFDAVQYHGDPNGVEKRLIQLLESRKDIQAQAMQPNKALQAAFIAKDIHHHLYEQGVVMGSDSNAAKSVLFSRSGPEELGINRAKYFSADQHKGLRIVAHIYLLISTLDKVSTKDGKVPESIQPKSWEFRQENIIAAYTDYMHRAGLQELIPLYCSLLEASKCYEVLSSSLILEDDVERRKMLLRLAQKATINTLAFVEEQASLCYQAVGPLNKSFAAKSSFKLIEEGPPQPAVGRPILADFFDNTEPEAGENDVAHEHLVRALEWLSLEDKTWPSVFSYGTKAYKFFLRHMHLNAARRLTAVAFTQIMKDMLNVDLVGEDNDRTDDPEFWKEQLEEGGITNVSHHKVAADARSFRELEALVKALDSLETVGALAAITRDVHHANDRGYREQVVEEIKKTMDLMRPLLEGWLMTGIQGGDKELAALRQAYLPETILAYVSALQFAGVVVTRDYLLHCMELSAIVAKRDSDLAPTIVEGGRMKELVEALAACSKSLAIATGEKRGTGRGDKKLRDMGWSRDVWSVKS